LTRTLNWPINSKCPQNIIIWGIIRIAGGCKNGWNVFDV
jgi:hypothetical protein